MKKGRFIRAKLGTRWRLRFSEKKRISVGSDASEQGISLVEVMVAMLLLSMAAISLGGLFITSIGTASYSNQRSQATTLASSELASVQSIPYAQVGFYSDQLGYSATGTDGLTTVTLGSCSTTLCSSTPPTPLLTPVSTISENGVTFTLDTSIVWANAYVPGSSTSTTVSDSQAYKLVTVQIQWSAPGGTQSESNSTIVYPGGLGPYTGPGSSTSTTTTSSDAPASPDVTATVPSAPGTTPDPGQTEVNLSWTISGATPDHYIIEWATSASYLPPPNGSGSGTPATAGSVQSSGSQPGTALSYQVQGLTPGTTYWFEVIPYSSTGQWATSNQAQATTDAPTPATCSWSSFTVTGQTSGYSDKVYLNHNHTLSESISLVVDSNGSCSDSNVTVSSTQGGVSDPGSPYSLSQGSGGQWVGAIPANGSHWTTGSHTLNLLVNGAALNPVVTQSLLVCSYSSDPNPGATC